MAVDLDELLLKLKWQEEGGNLPTAAQAKLRSLVEAQAALTKAAAPMQGPAVAGRNAFQAGWASQAQILQSMERDAKRAGGAVNQLATQTVGLGTATGTTGRSLGLLRTGLSMYAFQAVGATGITGKLASGLLMFGVGGPVTLGVVAGLALVGGAFKLASAEATKLREQSERLNMTWRTLRGEGHSLVALRDELNKAIKEEADAQRELERVRAPQFIGPVRVPRSPGEIVQAEQALSDATRVVEERRKLFAQGGADAVEDWGRRFLDGIKDLRLDEQLAQLLANRGEFEARGAESAQLWHRAFLEAWNHMPPIPLRLGGAVMPAVNAAGANLFQRIGPPGGTTAGTGAVFNQAVEDFQRIQTQGGVILRSLITPQQRFNEALEILRQNVEFGTLTADERAAAEKRLSDAMGVTTRKSQILGVTLIGAISGAIASVIQGGSAGSIIGGILGTVGGVVGIGNPLLGAGIAGLGTIVSSAASAADRHHEENLQELRRIRENTGRRGELRNISLTVLLNGKEVSAEILGDVMYGIGRAERTNAVPVLPPR